MSRLEELIRELCPNGVEYKKLGDIASISRGGNFQKKDFVDSGVPCIHYGQIYTRYGLYTDKVIAYISDEAGKKSKYAESNDIVMAVTSENVDDVCKCVAWLGNGKIAVSGHTAIIHHNQDAKYLAYYFNSIHFSKQKMKLAHGTKVIEVTPNRLNEVQLPVPPLEVQREIVRVLDCFTLLTAELTNELTARKKQYEYYRDNLLKFDISIPKVMLSDMVTVKRGTRVVRNQLMGIGRYPVYQNSIKPLGYYEKKNCPANTTFIISAGAAGEIGYSYNDFWAADDCFYLECSKSLKARYLYYALLCQKNYISSRVRKASIPRLDRLVVERLEIPIPSLSEQERIVSVLDRFDTLCNDLSNGLPAEIKARQKQYEYYRDKLLTFKELSK